MMIRKRMLMIMALLMIASLFVLVRILFGYFQKGDQGDSTAQDELQLRLKLFVPAPNNVKLPDATDDFIRQTIENKFNVRLDVTYMVPGTDYNAAIEAALLANDPPDMWIDGTNDGASKLALSGVLADMTPYISPLTMPNYYKYWISDKELKQFQIHNRFYRAPLPYDKNAYRSYYIRKDWLDRLGLDIPRTYSEYLKVLRAFTFDDPDGNGVRDTYGFTTSGNSSSLSTDWPEYAKNGLVYPAYMNNNTLVDMESDLRVGQVVDDILKVIDQGVVDPDWFLNQGTEHIDKAIQGKVGIVLGQSADFALDANPASIQSLSRAINPHANWVPFNPLGNEPLRAGISSDAPFVFSKLTGDSHPEKLKKIVEILDWLAGEEGFLLTHYGLEKKQYERSGNNIKLLAVSDDEVVRHNFMKIWSFFTPDSPSVLGLQVINPRLTERDKEIKTFLAALPVKPKLGVALAPPIGIDVGAFRARQNELQVKMLFSDKSGKMWPTYYEEIMTKYDGDQIIINFEKQVRSAQSTTTK
ncbi:extracellular solute-binding protein [Cohnella soli]|uniref:Extracellular solute-binding protein n=1 Tax=Cohnella soli TaxID=425005 RepID=A0ABW0HWN0_9BACL